MKKRLVPQVFIVLGIMFAAASCLPVPAQPTADAIATEAIKQAYVMQTLTQLAAPPTPTATFTPSPIPTETLTPTITLTPKPFKRPVTTAPAACRTGPGPEHKLVSNIPAKKYVELLGTGSVPGWYIIVNPYFRNACWIEAIYLKLDPRVDTSAYPTFMAPNP